MSTSPHRYTHPADTPAPPELDPDVVAETRAVSVLAGYGLAPGQAVEVELLVARSDGGPRIIEGTVVTGSRAVLVVDSANGRVTNRIPWPAVANVRDRPQHPGL